MIEKTFQIKPVALPDDLDSNWFHPDIELHDTIEDGVEYYTKEQWEQLKKNLGVEIIYDCWDYMDIPEIPEDDCSDWSKWKPTIFKRLCLKLTTQWIWARFKLSAAA